MNHTLYVTLKPLQVLSCGSSDLACCRYHYYKKRRRLMNRSRHMYGWNGVLIITKRVSNLFHMNVLSKSREVMYSSMSVLLLIHAFIFK